MTHPQLDDLRAAVRRAGVESTSVVVPNELWLGFITVPVVTDDGYGKLTYGEQTMLPVPARRGLTNGDIAKWGKSRRLKMLDRSLETVQEEAKWAIALEDADSACELLLTVLVDLYRVPPTQGLFITNVPDTDNWPNPIPVPAVWPPL